VVTLAVRVPRTLRRRVVIQCTEDDRTVQEFVEEAVRESLARAAKRRDRAS